MEIYSLTSFDKTVGFWKLYSFKSLKKPTLLILWASHLVEIYSLTSFVSKVCFQKPPLSKDVSLSQVRIDVKKKVLTKLDASRVFGNIWNVTFESDILVNCWILLPKKYINSFHKLADSDLIRNGLAKKNNITNSKSETT